MSTSRPWWASEGPVQGGIDPDQDPVEAHRGARRGQGYRPPPSSPDEWRSEPSWTEPEGNVEDRSSSGSTTHADVCGVCPVCAAARVLADVRPELLTHLAEAGRHLSAAVRALTEAPPRGDTPPPGPSTHERSEQPVRRIDLD